MSRSSASLVLGYHGCDRDIGRRALAGELNLLTSQNDYDWLGPGVYFWEADYQRAMDFAVWKQQRGLIAEPYVVGAVLDLGNCLDLAVQENLLLLNVAYMSFSELQEKAGLPLPENRNAPGDTNADRLLRYLDCAVIRHLHEIMKLETGGDVFDTVRGMFQEGGSLFSGSAFREKTHVQISVLNTDCIIGIFEPRPPAGLSRAGRKGRRRF